MVKKKIQNKKSDVFELKKDLVEDLDQFLLDADFGVASVKEEKQKALQELDKLIKQDLSYSQILNSIKKEVKAEIKIEETEKVQNLEDLATNSAHVIDLRKSKVEPSVKPKFDFAKYKDSFIKSYGKSTKKINWQLPKIKNTSFSVALNKSLLFALIVAVILLPIRGMVMFGQIKNDKGKILNFSQEGLISLQSGVISASENSYQEAQGNFQSALDNFSQAQDVLNEYQRWMLNAASLMPVVGKPISLSRNMLSVATNISEAATVLNQTLQSNGNPTEYIVLLNDQINKTLPYLESANADLEGISSSLLPANFREYFDSLKLYLPSTIANLEELNDIFSLSSDLLGHSSEKRYVVLFQNNNEIRATGGFIGSFALFDVYQGKIVNLEIPKGGLYDLEAGQGPRLKAPQALSLINSGFNIWDANWWYDFPTSAQKIIWFYQQAGASSLDGVIAINANVLAELLAVLGPVSLEDYGITINQENIFDVLQEEVELNYDEELNQPKAVIADLVPIVLEKLLSNNDKHKEVVEVFAKTLASKDIQIYSENKVTQDSLVNFGWSGKSLDYNKDYLAVINTNIAGGKTDNNIYQTIDHQARISVNGEIINTLKITRSNKAEEEALFGGLYGGNTSYLRIYTPLNSEFIEAVGFDKIPDNYFAGNENAQIDKDLAQEEIKMIDNNSATEIYTSLNKTVFANWMTLAPGETKTVLIKYKLPFRLDLGDPLVNNWWQKMFKKNVNLDNYSLVVQSQSGLKNNLLNSSVILPDNVKLIFNNASDQASMNVTDNLLTYTKELNRDQYFGFILTNK
ncbi:MAG: DUF4012 domain-containing protein [Candidatus Komeilibacteria bacterium]|jgi:hypothetical protein|nr:DUF4012 domain-containing protein [Candidatus Komeilibacteria bacterium]